MDIETIGGLALLVIYFLLRRAGQKKPGPVRPAPGPSSIDTSPSGTLARTPPATLEDALKEIREALSGAGTRTAPVETGSRRTVESKPRTLPQATSTPVRKKRGDEFHTLETRTGESVHQEFGTGEKFESKEQSGTLEQSSQALSRLLPTTEPSRGKTRESKTTDKSRSFRADLSNSTSLRNAFILSEILGPPRSRR